MADEPRITKAKGPEAPLAKAEPEGDDARPRSWKRWVLGWIVLPGSFVGGVVLAGALVGAHYSESWFARLVSWVVGLF
jgi:hypothetical protein